MGRGERGCWGYANVNGLVAYGVREGCQHIH